MLLLYNIAMMFTALMALPYLMMTLVQPKRRATFIHRLGWRIGQKYSPDTFMHRKQPIWVHALSVGEVLSAEPIIDRLREKFPNQPVVFSASTHSGMNTAQRIFADRVDGLLYYPYDLLFSVKQVVNQVQPKLVVIVETDVWPNFQMYLRRRGIPVLLVNARLSAGSFKGYRLLGRFYRRVMASFHSIGVQSEPDAARFLCLGVPEHKIFVTGNIKFDQKGSDLTTTELERIRSDIGIAAPRPVIVLGSTHRGEETIGVEVFQKLKQRFENLLLIVAPRDPGRAGGIAQQLRESALAVGFLSALKLDETEVRYDVLVVNTIGILRKLYALADVAFIGGSLVPEGGHNPLEAAAFGKAVVFGPDMSDFADVARKLTLSGGALCVHDSRELYQAFYELLADKQHRRQVGKHAFLVFRENQGAVDKTMDLIRQAFEKESPDGARSFR